jgi:hypothetical protein
MMQGDTTFRFPVTGFPCAVLGMLLLLVPGLLSSCGRRADPVFIPAYEDSADDGGAESGAQGAAGAPQPGSAETGRSGLIPPASVQGIYTGRNIVLTWDEASDRETLLYRVYRMNAPGGGFAVIGETVTPAFTDRDIQRGQVYTYRVTVVSEKTESDASSVVTIRTDND